MSRKVIIDNNELELDEQARCTFPQTNWLKITAHKEDVKDFLRNQLSRDGEYKIEVLHNNSPIMEMDKAVLRTDTHLNLRNEGLVVVVNLESEPSHVTWHK